MAFLAPGGRAGRGDLVAWMPVQIFARRDQLDGLLVVECHAREEVEELRPFIPPMTEQFRIIRRDNKRRMIQNSHGGDRPA